MKILLLGEYSGVFTELSLALKKLGHEVVCINDGDGYKKYHSDIDLSFPKRGENVVVKLFRTISFFCGMLGYLSFIKQWKKLKIHLCGFDIVQFVNPIVFARWGSIPNYILTRYVCKHNKKVFLSVLGFDYYQVKWSALYDNDSGYYTPSFRKMFQPESYAFKYLYCLGYKMLNDYIVKEARKIIPGSLNYKLCYDWTGKTTKVIPFPINDNKIGEPFNIKNNDRIIIFHGWQKGKEKFKGNDVFDRVIRRVVERYGRKVHYEIVQGIPYDEYVKKFKDSHIFIDQLYTNDKGTNGMLGMAAGKIVFAGFTKEALASYPHYNGEKIGIPVTTDELNLFDSFCHLIEDRDLMNKISSNAINFIKKNHEAKIVAKLYLETWSI